jgi:hypothetical protein
MHRIYTSAGLSLLSEKDTLAKAITSLCTSTTPALYVVVLFIDRSKDSFFIGGEQNEKFVRFNVPPKVT